MRPILFLLALAALLPFAGAASNGVYARDFTDDQSPTLVDAPGLCHAPSTDIVNASLTSDGATLYGALAVLDASDASVSCDPAVLTVGPVIGTYTMSVSLPSTDPLWAGELRMRATRDADGEDGCGSITLPDGWYTTACLGGHEGVGDVLSWTLPVRGVAEFWEPNVGLTSELRAYDLSGLTGEARVSTSARLPYPPVANSFASLYDRLALGEITL